MKNGKPTLYRDQYGSEIVARTVKELRENSGGGSVRKMYVDKKDGSTVHIGYVVGPHWYTAYQRVELPA